jgi:hypothetical protein
VVDWDQGTAHEDFDVPGVIASGKTGTAEYCDEYPQCLDKDGRVKTSHAWFTSYAPSYNPEIATVVFVYGGGEGSKTAVPITNKILRHYFGIEEELAEDEAEVAEEVPAEEIPLEEESATTLPADTIFTGRLLGTDSRDQDGAGVSGFIFDANNQGIGDVTIDIIVDGDIVDQVISGSTGQFDYNELDPAQATSWQLRLADYPRAPILQLEVAAGLYYLVEFKAQEN